MNKLKKKLKEKHILPVYRCDVIECAKEQLINSVLPIPGICVLLRYALCEFNISYLEGNIKEIFPLLTLRNAHIHGGDCSPYARENDFWWECHCWSGGRERFFQWLCEQYKDDKTKIRI